MTAQLFILLLIATVVAVYAGVALVSWFKMRGTRVVVCPETEAPAAVEVDCAHAAASAVWEKSDLQLKSCSRWPEREGCNQACVTQIAKAPHDTLATSMLSRFFEGKDCAVCHRAIPNVHAGDQKPGLLNPTSHDICAWDDIPAQDLQAVFRTHLPICSNCQVVETFRREHPELVTDRQRTAASAWPSH